MYVQCFNCKKPMTYFAAGISRKTGKEYKAFYSCPICKKAIGEELAKKQAEQGFEKSETFTPTPKETGEKIIIELLEKVLEGQKEINERLDAINYAVGNNMVNIGK